MSEALRPHAPDGPLGRPETWFVTVLRVLVHGITAAVIAWPLTVPDGVVAAVLGAALGSLAARFVSRSALRAPSLLGLGVLSLFVVAVFRWAVVDAALFPQSLGPATALLLGDAVVFGVGGFVVSCTLRTLSARRPSFSIAEAGLVAGGFATLLVAHRHGAIHRPYGIADPLIARGEDPTVAILLIGGVGAVVIGLLLLSERSLLRSLFHLAVIAALLLVVLATTSMVGPPPPPESGGGALGLQDDDSEEQQQQNDQSRRSSDDLDFLDEYPSGGATPDAVVIFHDDYSVPGGYYYFRQNAFSQYNGRKLVGTTLAGVDEDVRNIFPTTYARDVDWAPPAGGDRTTVETTVAMLSDNSAPLGLEAPERFIPATNPAPNRFRRVYRVQSISITAEPIDLMDRPVGHPSWSAEEREHYLAGPDDPRYAALATHIVEQLPDDLRELPVARAYAITQYLGFNGTYSLRSRHAEAEDPTADFLFGDLTGYCVHFAHAAVFLMRAAGIPARVGTGYAVAEANREGGSGLLLRNSDQHAWPEVYVGGGNAPPDPEFEPLAEFAAAWREGRHREISPSLLQSVYFSASAWLVEQTGALSEPKPSREGPAVAMATWLEGEAELLGKDPHDLLDAVVDAHSGEASGAEGAGWLVMDVAPQNVLDPPGDPPDPQLQRLLAEMARGSSAIDDVPPPRPMAELARQTGRQIAIALGALALLLLVFGYGWKLRRWVHLYVGSTPARIYLAALYRLSAGGIHRRWGESPESFARRVSAELPTLRPLTNQHLAAAFGGRDGDVPAMRRDFAKLTSELRLRVPWWRRWLGAINPYSWVMLTR